MAKYWKLYVKAKQLFPECPHDWIEAHNTGSYKLGDVLDQMECYQDDRPFDDYRVESSEPNPNDQMGEK